MTRYDLQDTRARPTSPPLQGVADRTLASLRLRWRVRWRAWQARRRSKPRLKRLRLLAILVAVLLLGGISFAFGMFMAVASDLPALEDWVQYKDAHNSMLLDDHGRLLAVLSRRNQILLAPRQIPPIVKEAVISVEDKRFYGNGGVDPRSLGRAFLHDVLGQGGVQGASTIEEQFVKNALSAQSHRTIFEKLREAALAFQIAHHWSKEKIVTEYLNTIYFGNGAYGIEAAARTYFGHEPDHVGCGTPQRPCVSELRPWEAALLAGLIQSPTAYDPVEHPLAARERRNLVLRQMLLQGYVDRSVYEQSVAEPLPGQSEIQPPREQLAEGVDAGYFTSWVDQQVISRYGAGLAFDGGLRVKTTLDLSLQRAAERAVNGYLASPEGPTASLVAIENSTGDVRAMVGGRDYEASPFNLATEGERQPGSSFKAFDLAAALQDGISPYSVWTSKVKIFPVPNSSESFVVHNDEGSYTGSNTLIGATEVSDNSIYAEVGIKVGTRRIAALARRMGITTPISTNYAMTIGGLKTGVTALDMAHAYETIAHGGDRVSGTLAGARGAPVGIQEVADRGHPLLDGRHREVNDPRLRRVLPASIAQTETEMLETVITHGTGTAAAIGQFAAGKTGTTTNYVDAWFVGFDGKYTVAVWVGYPEGAKSMATAFGGKPVYGGTFPALIWKSFMLSALQIEREEAAAAAARRAGRLVSKTTRAPVEGSQGVSGASGGRAGGGQNTTGRGGTGEEQRPKGAGGGAGTGSGQRAAGSAGGGEGAAAPGAATQGSSAPSTSAPTGPSQPSPSGEQAPAAPAAPSGGPSGGAAAPSSGAKTGG